MSFAPGFAPDGLAQWRALDFELQELVLDEVERLAIDPPGGVEHVADVVVDVIGMRHYLFVHVLVDRPRQQVIVVGVGHHARPVAH